MTSIATAPLPESKSSSTFQKVKTNAERYVSMYMVGLVLLGCVFTIFSGLWTPYLVTSIFVLSSWFAIKKLFPRTNLSIYMSSLLISLINVFFLYSMGGWQGAHFLVFTSCVVLISFQEWKAFLPLYTIIVLYTLFVSYCQIYHMFEAPAGAEYGLYLDDNSDPDNFNWHVVVYHEFILALFFSFCGFLSYSLRRTTENRVNSYNKLESQLSVLNENIDIATELGKGNFNLDLVDDRDDELSKALYKMATSLKEAMAKEVHDRYIATGLADVGDILRQNMSDLNELCEKVIFSLVNTLEANQGGVFLLKNEKNGEEYLELNASCAYNRKKFLQKRIELKESMLGQAYIEKNIIHLDNIPEDYSSISSGLGETSPRHLIIVPLISNQKVVGVIEIASLKEFNDTKVEFIQRASESIASTIIFAKSNEDTNRLLSHSEQMASELQAQEEEMRQNLEELQATQEEMKRAEKELKLKESNLTAFINSTESTIFALDTDYNVTIVNSFLREKYANNGIDLKPGRNIFDILPENVHEFWKERYDRAFNGERFHDIVENPKGVFMESIYNPIFNDDDEVIGASVTADVITEKLESEKRLKEKEHELETIVNQITSSVLVLNSDFNINMFNVVAQERLRRDGVEIVVGKNFVECFNNHPLSEVWESWAKQVFETGEPIFESTNRGTEENPIYINVEVFPVRNLENEISQVGIFGVDVTTDKVKMHKAQKELTVIKQAFEQTAENTIIFNKQFVPEHIGSLAQDTFEKHQITIESNLSLEESNNEEEIIKIKTAFERALKGNDFNLPVNHLFESEDNYSEIRFKSIKSENDVIAVSISLN